MILDVSEGGVKAALLQVWSCCIMHHLHRLNIHAGATELSTDQQ